MKRNLQKGTSLRYQAVELNDGKTGDGIKFIPAQPGKVADRINAGYPLIEDVVSYWTIKRRYDDKTIAFETVSGTDCTNVTSMDCFCDETCDIVGAEGLAQHLSEHWSDYYTDKWDSLVTQAKRLIKRNDFPKLRVFEIKGTSQQSLSNTKGPWLFCSTSVDSYLTEHVARRKA